MAMKEICVWKGLILALFFFAFHGQNLGRLAVDRPTLEPIEVDAPILEPIEVDGPILEPIEVDAPILEPIEVDGQRSGP